MSIDLAITQYAYAPIPYFNGKVLKCQGGYTGTNMDAIVYRKDFTAAQVVILDGFRGDRINVADYSLYV